MIAIKVPKIRGARIIDKKLIPDALSALISLSSESLPNVIRVANKTAIGTERAMIQAKFKNRYSSMVRRSRPLPKNRSIARNKKLMNNTKVIINNEKIKGKINSLTKYLDKSCMVEITILCSNLEFQ